MNVTLRKTSRNSFLPAKKLRSLAGFFLGGWLARCCVALRVRRSLPLMQDLKKCPCCPVFLAPRRYTQHVRECAEEQRQEEEQRQASSTSDAGSNDDPGSEGGDHDPDHEGVWQLPPRMIPVRNNVTRDRLCELKFEALKRDPVSSAHSCTSVALNQAYSAGPSAADCRPAHGVR